MRSIETQVSKTMNEQAGTTGLEQLKGEEPGERSKEKRGGGSG